MEDYTVNLTYCGAEGAAGTGSDWISNVTLNTLDHATGQTAYSNLKDNSTVVYRNNTYELEVLLNYAFAQDNVHAWIDFDRDNSFTVNERIGMSNPVDGANSTSVGSFTLPEDAPTGETTMRVRVIYDDTNPQNPCGSYFGEVEDYTVVVADDSSCPISVELGGESGGLGTGAYRASGTLSSTSDIAGTSSVEFYAGSSIHLGNGFKVANGAGFTAAIGSCP